MFARLCSVANKVGTSAYQFFCMSAITPYFSVVIPTYNRAGFIAATLDSVLGQHFTDFEVLVVDDGSTDNTAAVVQAYTDPRIQYLPKQNAERGAARNYGFERARGVYVLFLDSDDRFQPAHLATLHTSIQQLKAPNFIAAKFNFDRDGRLFDSDLINLPAGTYGVDFFVHGNPLACNFAVRRQNPKLRLFEADRQFAAVEDWMFLLENTQDDVVHLVDAVTLTMSDHDDRSMKANNQNLIRRWLSLPPWVDAHVRLTSAQRQELLGHIHYLCAIHSYADGHRQQSLQHAAKAAAGLSLSKATVLLMRCLLGVGTIDVVKKLVQRS